MLECPWIAIIGLIVGIVGLIITIRRNFPQPPSGTAAGGESVKAPWSAYVITITHNRPFLVTLISGPAFILEEDCPRGDDGYGNYPLEPYGFGLKELSVKMISNPHYTVKFQILTKSAPDEMLLVKCENSNFPKNKVTLSIRL